MKKIWRLIAIVFIVSLSVQTAPPVNRPAAAQEWNWQNPLPQGNRLNGVWGNSSSNVFAVGEGGTILRYNGSRWDNITTTGTSENLYGVWGSSASDVFAVGWQGTIIRYNGSIWSPMTSGASNYLNGVWGSSASDVFAVGDYGTILHYGARSMPAPWLHLLLLNDWTVVSSLQSTKFSSLSA